MDSILRTTVLQNYPNTVAISAYHGMQSGFSTVWGDSIASLYQAKHAPSGFPDGLGYDVNYLQLNEAVKNRYLDEPKTPVAIEIDAKIWDPINGKVEFTLNVRNDGPELTGSYWYNVIITEDNINHGRRTSHGCATPDTSGQPYYVQNYFNSWVIRDMVHWTYGKSLIESSWPEGQEITQSYSIKIENEWILENCNVIINVFKKADSLYKSPVMQVIKEPVMGENAIADGNSMDKGIIRIFPNPARNAANIHVSLSDRGFCSLNVYDMNGQHIEHLLNGNMNPGLYNIEIETNTMLRGTYLVVLETNKGRTTKKLVIL
jgi:hypothetical protein